MEFPDAVGAIAVWDLKAWATVGTAGSSAMPLQTRPCERGYKPVSIDPRLGAQTCTGAICRVRVAPL